MKYRKYRYNVSNDRYLVENKGIDPAILAAAINRTEQFVRMRQRKLGLRKCVPSRKRSDHDGLGVR